MDLNLQFSNELRSLFLTCLYFEETQSNQKELLQEAEEEKYKLAPREAKYLLSDKERTSSLTQDDETDVASKFPSSEYHLHAHNEQQLCKLSNKRLV